MLFYNLSQASTTVLKSIESIYKQTLKIFDQRTNSYHYCNIVKKHDLLSFDNVKYIWLMLVWFVMQFFVLFFALFMILSLLLVL